MIISNKYDIIGGEGGPICIMTSDNRYIVPRQVFSDDYITPKVALYKKKIYDVKEKELLKELILIGNKPKMIDYVLGPVISVSDEDKGIKGYISTRNDEQIMVV